MYLGKWHSSEVAVKCLNPGMFFSAHSDLNNNVAILDLLREADLLGSLRHPNVVWVYGIVLPRLVRPLPQRCKHMDVYSRALVKWLQTPMYLLFWSSLVIVLKYSVPAFCCALLCSY